MVWINRRGTAEEGGGKSTVSTINECNHSGALIYIVPFYGVNN